MKKVITPSKQECLIEDFCHLARKWDTTTVEGARNPAFLSLNSTLSKQSIKSINTKSPTLHQGPTAVAIEVTPSATLWGGVSFYRKMLWCRYWSKRPFSPLQADACNYYTLSGGPIIHSWLNLSPTTIWQNRINARV